MVDAADIIWPEVTEFKPLFAVIYDADPDPDDPRTQRVYYDGEWMNVSIIGVMEFDREEADA